MGLLDWLSPALTVGTTALAAQRQGQADNIARQQAANAAALKAYQEKRKAEDEHLKTMAETNNLQNTQKNELERINTRATAEGTVKETAAVADQGRKDEEAVRSYLLIDPMSPESQRVKAIIAKNGGDIHKSMPEIGGGYTAKVKDTEDRRSSSERMAQEVYSQGQQTSRNNADNAASMDRTKYEVDHRLPPGANQRPTSQQLQAQGYLPEIESAAHDLDNITPQFLAKETSGIPVVGNYLMTSKGRQFQQRGYQFINNTIYAKSGKAITQGEQDRLFHEMIPEPGDDQKTLAQKSEARKLFMQGLYIVAGKSPMDRGPAVLAPRETTKTPTVQPNAGTFKSKSGKVFEIPE